MSRRNGGESPLRFEWERAVKALPLPPMVKLVALTLATYGDLDGQDVRPGYDNLVRDTGAGRATVYRAMAMLRDVGLIVSVGTANRRRRMAEEYRLAVPADVLDRVVSHSPVRAVENPADQVSQGDVNGPDQVSHRDDQVSHRDGSGLTQRRKGSQCETPPTHHHLSDHLMTTSAAQVVDVSTDRARAVDGRRKDTP